MSKRIKTSALVLALMGAVAMADLATAQTGAVATSPVATLAQAATPAAGAGEKSRWLNLGQIYDRVTAAGYTDVREIEREKGGYEVKARDSQGRHVKLYLDPVSGKIVRERLRDHD